MDYKLIEFGIDATVQAYLYCM